MEFDEWKAVTKATVEECRKHGTPVMIGVTSTYTLGAQRRAAYAAKLGADAIQLALPFWMEVNDRQLVPFFKAVTDACPGLGLTIYETLRAKKAFTVGQHHAIYEATGSYLAVKANANTIGRTPEGCRQLSEFINVWVGENELNRLGPHGAVGCASSMVYMNPRRMLHMFDLLRQKKWDELQPWTDKVDRLIKEGLATFTENGFTDTAYDHLMGVVTGFLSMSLRSRGPYISATEQDVRQLRTWMKANIPEFLEL
jgi:dihydrodipicolinate synthase/N-acetylneuraminate lyase